MTVLLLSPLPSLLPKSGNPKIGLTNVGRIVYNRNTQLDKINFIFEPPFSKLYEGEEFQKLTSGAQSYNVRQTKLGEFLP